MLPPSRQTNPAALAHNKRWHQRDLLKSRKVSMSAAI